MMLGDFRHFALVVSVHAYTQNGDYPVVAHVSERIIVRVRGLYIREQ